MRAGHGLSHSSQKRCSLNEVYNSARGNASVMPSGSYAYTGACASASVARAPGQQARMLSALSAQSAPSNAPQMGTCLLRDRRRAAPRTSPAPRPVIPTSYSLARRVAGLFYHLPSALLAPVRGLASCGRSELRRRARCDAHSHRAGSLGSSHTGNLRGRVASRHLRLECSRPAR
jgi:hypothetical protein